MKNRVFPSLIISLFLLSFSLLPAFASPAFFKDVYILGGVGYTGVNQAQFAQNDDRVITDLVGGDTEPFGNLFKAAGNFSWRGGMGAWLTESVGIEFNYFGIETMDDDFTLLTGTILNKRKDGITFTPRLKTSSMTFFDISGITRHFFQENFWSFARLGVAYAHTKRHLTMDVVEDFSGDVTTFEEDLALEDDSGWGAAFGLGFQYNLTKAVGLRLEANTIQATNENDMYGVTANVVVNLADWI